MTYLVLARKWRPRSFDTLVGQDHVVRALTHALDTQRLHHAWLFTGTRGVGKTTLSRILAKSLNCETGITSKPCGVCRACTEIDAGRFVDYLELDAASNRGVEEMTQLLEQAVYAPGAGRFKVYMIDEVHMLTGHAFNAMLKTLEEPPPHVKFILATTDPQKIPVTVLSRCLQFNLKQMPPESIVGHLQAVLGQEQIGFEVPALRLIGQAASGSMRDALSLTDQAIAYSAGNLTEDAVRGMLGTIDQRHLVRLLDALATGTPAACWPWPMSLLPVVCPMLARWRISPCCSRASRSSNVSAASPRPTTPSGRISRAWRQACIPMRSSFSIPLPCIAAANSAWRRTSTPGSSWPVCACLPSMARRGRRRSAKHHVPHPSQR
ncbi:DNA polymerase III, subunit gamma and tau [Bordetella holmesii 70147]|nr:DNA polymerase III, subunit gamma and tau [Bordetella holmesii 70147]